MKAEDPYFLDLSFLDLAKAAAATVGRVIRNESVKGNGCMISERLFLTNHHIIHDAEVAKLSFVEFDFELNGIGYPKIPSKFVFAPEDFLVTSPEDDLDFTVVAVGKRVSGDRQLSDFGFCPLKENESAYSLGDFVNIIGHPGKEYKKIVLRNNKLMAHSEEVLHYYATVISGSSGSPVFNDRFESIALHHYRIPSRPAFTQDGKPGPTKIAEGIRVSAIIKRINSEKKQLSQDQRRLIDKALSCPFSHPSSLNSKLKQPLKFNHAKEKDV